MSWGNPNSSVNRLTTSPAVSRTVACKVGTFCISLSRTVFACRLDVSLPTASSASRCTSASGIRRQAKAISSPLLNPRSPIAFSTAGADSGHFLMTFLRISTDSRLFVLPMDAIAPSRTCQFSCNAFSQSCSRSDGSIFCAANRCACSRINSFS